MRKKNPSGLFFFFDRYAIGGAQRVHLDILESVKHIYKQVFFTRLSLNDKMKKEFYDTPNADIKDIHIWCDYLLLRLFTVHYYCFYINRHKSAHVFSSNSTFFYDMLFFINNRIIKTELLHNFTYGNNGMEFFGLSNHKYMDNRMVIDKATYNNITKQYSEYHISESYNNRVHIIEPGVRFPVNLKKDYSQPLKILYAGRGGAQKRIFLLNQIAEKCIQEKWLAEFHFAGSMMDELSDYVKQHSVIHGEISEQGKMYELYRVSHAILMTSAYEGFPMLIKESMACGCVPVVTALEGNKSHLRNNENALLIQNPEDEKQVVEQGVQYIQHLLENKNELERLSMSARNYAEQYFDRGKFIEAYKRFFANDKDI
ncbi:MAG: glycosyltransferase family 4 protein [Bacteroidetes bacterium]|nr:glycosyltransferase family 4 protein [Bacteroidota bacterium]